MQMLQERSRVRTCAAVKVPVMVHEHIDNATEEVRLLGTEEASCDLVNGLLQLWNTVIVFRRIIAVEKIIILGTIRGKRNTKRKFPALYKIVSIMAVTFKLILILT